MTASPLAGGGQILFKGGRPLTGAGAAGIQSSSPRHYVIISHWLEQMQFKE